MDIQISRNQKNTLNGRMIKSVLIVFFLFAALIGRSQMQFSLGGSLGYDNSYHQFDFMPKTNVNATPDFNFGVNGILKIKDWLRVKAEIHYANMSFTRSWETGSTDPKAINLSKVGLNNLDVSPLVDFRFLKLGKLDLYATTGFRFEFQMGKWEKSYTIDGSVMDYDHVMDKYNESKAGVVGGLLFKYNINDQFALTLAPQYTYYFDPQYFMNEYDDSYKFDFIGIELNKVNLQRASVNIGLEWNF